MVICQAHCVAAQMQQFHSMIFQLPEIRCARCCRSEPRASNPKSRGHERWLTERAWASLYHEHELPVHIFRLGGWRTFPEGLDCAGLWVMKGFDFSSIMCWPHRITSSACSAGIYGPGRSALDTAMREVMSQADSHWTPAHVVFAIGIAAG